MPRRIYRWLRERQHELARIHLWLIGALIGLGLIIFIWTSTGFDRLAIAVLAGSVLLYHFVIAPRRAQQRIRTRNPAPQTIRLEFGNEGVSVDLENAGLVRRPWTAAVQYWGTRGFFSSYDARPETLIDEATIVAWARTAGIGVEELDGLTGAAACQRCFERAAAALA